MSEQVTESEIATLQQFVPGASPESLREFAVCVKSNQHLKTSIPLGVMGGLITYVTLPKRLGMMRPAIAYVAGFSVFLISKLKHMQVCYKKAFGTANLPERQDRTQLNTAPGFGLKIDQQEPETYSAESADSFIHESLISSNYDPPFENASTEFRDPSDYFKQEEPSKKQKVEEKRVTYDDLWMQHRKMQMEDQYRDLMGYSANKSKEAETAQRRPMEEPTISDAEYDNRDTWN